MNSVNMDGVDQAKEFISSLKSNDKKPVVYFIGIGGIGMSALAKYFLSMGAEVSGYDRTSTPLTKEMEEMGMKIHYHEDLDKAPRAAGLIIYTPAVPAGHKELVFYSDNNYPVVKRSDVLGAITESSFNICVAGTHGKTTISTMIAHILRDTGYGANAFLGGISVNYSTNFWSSEKNVAVVEADEYDRSFLKLSPDIAIISAMDPDHLDIYGTAEAMEDAFIEFAKRVKLDGLLISRYGIKRANDLPWENHVTYSLNDPSDMFAMNIKMGHGSYRFDVKLGDKVMKDVELNMGGLHNIENSIAAITVADNLGIEEEKIRSAVSSFKGVRRRFEYVIKEERKVLIDDYAHHPEELKALIRGAKGLFEGLRMTVVFQPHLFSRTKDLAKGFAQSLDMADDVILLPIYPARELPMEGVSSKMILDQMWNKEVSLLSKDELLEWMNENETELVIMSGAGDIDTLVEPVKDILNSKK